MQDFDSKLKKDVSLLRETLHHILNEDKNNITRILKVSQELDELIVKYIKQNNSVVA